MEWLKNYLDLNTTEKKGTLALLCLIVLLIIFRLLQPFLTPSELLTQDELKLMKEIVRKIEQNAENVKKSRDSSGTYRDRDLNKLSRAGLLSLGLKDSQVTEIMELRKKGFTFRQPGDFLAAPSVSYEDIKRLLPARTTPAFGPQKKDDQKSVVELNSADTSDLITLAGIGSYYARKITRFRDKLGGFYKAGQLLEVYGLDPEVLARNKGRITVDPEKVRKIPINTAPKEVLAGHPYLGWKIANWIVRFREQHGPYTAIKEISNSVLIPDTLYSKIAPYLTLDD